MANPTTNYGFVLPTSTDLVTDLPADFDVALQGVDTRLKALQPGTTLGDLAYSSATANTNTRLAVGSTGNVLTVAGGVPTWAAPSSGGMTQLATGSLSGASVTISSISQDYKNLQLVVRDWYPDTNDRQVAIQFNGDDAAPGNYFGYTVSANQAGSVSGPSQSANPQIAIPAVARASNDRNHCVYDIFDYANTIANKNVFGQGATTNSSGTYAFGTTNYAWQSASAITSITIKLNANNYTAGTYILYGVK
jgi:hypothetical protein